MDAVIFIVLALIFVLRVEKSGEPENTDVQFTPENTNRKIGSNELLYEDTEAFYEIAHALGFPKEMR